MFQNICSGGGWGPISTIPLTHCAALRPSLTWMLIKIFYVLILSDPHNHAKRNRLLWLLLSFFFLTEEEAEA